MRRRSRGLRPRRAGEVVEERKVRKTTACIEWQRPLPPQRPPAPPRLVAGGGPWASWPFWAAPRRPWSAAPQAAWGHHVWRLSSRWACRRRRWAGRSGGGWGTGAKRSGAMRRRRVDTRGATERLGRLKRRRRSVVVVCLLRCSGAALVREQLAAVSDRVDISRAVHTTRCRRNTVRTPSPPAVAPQEKNPMESAHRAEGTHRLNHGLPTQARVVDSTRLGAVGWGVGRAWIVRSPLAVQDAGHRRGGAKHEPGRRLHWCVCAFTSYC
jgi:hypothetical protein